MPVRPESNAAAHRAFHGANLILYGIAISTALTMLPLLGFYHAAAALVDDVNMSGKWQTDFKAIQFDGTRKWVWAAIWVFTFIDVFYALFCLEQCHTFAHIPSSRASKPLHPRAISYTILILFCLYDLLLVVAIALHIYLFIANALIAPSFCTHPTILTSLKSPRPNSHSARVSPTMQIRMQDCKQINSEILIFGAFSSIFAAVRALVHVLTFVSRLWAVIKLGVEVGIPSMRMRRNKEVHEGRGWKCEGKWGGESVHEDGDRDIESEVRKRTENDVEVV